MILTGTTVAEHALGLLTGHPRGWSLPQPFYTDPEFFALDVEHVFASRWLFVAHTCEVAEVGAWVRVDIADDSIIIVRGRDGEIRSFFNTCRHRGSLICLAQSGHARRLVCPYHQWSYHLDGSFAGGRYLADDFDPSEFGLAPVHCKVVGGYVFVCLADSAPDFEPFAAGAAPFLAPHHLDDEVKVAHTQVIVEQTNWKLVMENNRECYHCVAAHPELMHSIAEFDGPGTSMAGGVQNVLDRKLAEWDADGIVHEHTLDGGNEWRVVRIPFTNESVAMTIDGTPASAKLLGSLTPRQRELGSVRLLHLPNTWNHVQSDHVVSFSVLPISATETQLTTRWLVHRDAVEGIDYDLHHLTEVWVATNNQDRTLAENNQRGIASRGYRPGPYTPGIEAGVVDFTDWYTDLLRERLS